MHEIVCHTECLSITFQEGKIFHQRLQIFQRVSKAPIDSATLSKSRRVLQDLDMPSIIIIGKTIQYVLYNTNPLNPGIDYFGFKFLLPGRLLKALVQLFFVR